MKQLSILITWLVLSTFTLSGAVYPGLKVNGDYKVLRVVQPTFENSKLSGRKIEYMKRLIEVVDRRIESHGIKPVRTDSTDHPVSLFFSLNPKVQGTEIALYCHLCKHESKGGSGSLIREQGLYQRRLPTFPSYRVLKKTTESLIDKFMTDYIESNQKK
jgi:hypothetical protein